MAKAYLQSGPSLNFHRSPFVTKRPRRTKQTCKVDFSQRPAPSHVPNPTLRRRDRFNGWTGPERENHDFLKKTLRFLERSKDVERYAYFEPGKGKEHSLFKKDGGLSRMGELYRDAGT